MEDFKILSDDELAALSNKERRDYLRKKKEYDNTKLVNETANQEEETTPAVAAKATTPAKTITVAPVIKKSNAGRKSIAEAEKKQQIMLTIEAESKAKLESVDEKNFKKLLGRYIDKNIDEIVAAIEKL